MFDKLTDEDLTGVSLFAGAESFLKDLSEEDESSITGGKRSRSGRLKRRRRRRRLRRLRARRRRIARSRSNSISNS
ncbi:hypothetical protein C7B61_14970 [filamentous cyanobacterium CCP1]|nr:hypothetical protein C7B61_14970 [filamentous cyanobacterium CCP1]